jgi:hypothetical protein
VSAGISTGAARARYHARFATLGSAATFVSATDRFYGGMPTAPFVTTTNRFYGGMPAATFVSTTAAWMPFVSTRMSFMSATVGPVTMIGFKAAAAVIAPYATIDEAMIAPAVAVAPAGPGTHTEEDPVEEESRPVKVHWRAGIGRSFVIAVGADRRNAHIDFHLCFRRPRQDQAREQCCRIKENFVSAHM